MSQYVIDGKKYDIDVPDNWSDDQVLAYFDDHGPQKPKPVKPAKAPQGDSSEGGFFDGELMGAGETLASAGSHIAPSAMKFGGEMVQMIKHPVETAKSMYGLGKGIVQLLIPGEQGGEETARAVGRHMKGRYGTLPKIQKTFATDPVGFAADLSSLFTGGGMAAVGVGKTIAKAGKLGAGKIPSMAKAGSAVEKAGMLGREMTNTGMRSTPPGMLQSLGESIASGGQGLAKAANYIDPITGSAKAIGKTGRAVGNALSALEGKLTGVGHDVVKQTFAAGLRNSKAWKKGFKNVEDADVLVREARGNIKGLATTAKAKYLRDLKKMIRENPTADWKPIQKKLAEQVRSTFDGVTGKYSDITDVGEVEKLGLVYDVIMERLADPSMSNAGGFDHLKRTLNKIKISEDSMPTAFRVRAELAAAVKAEISNVYKPYGQMMDEYSGYKNLHEELGAAFGKEKHASMDMTLRKLQSAMRNQVNTGMGNKRKLLKEIDPTESLADKISGQAMREIMPRGMMGATGPAMSVGAGVLGGPAAGIGLGMLESPRAIGRATFTAGQAGMPFAKASEALGQTGRKAVGKGLLYSGRLDKEREKDEKKKKKKKGKL